MLKNKSSILQFLKNVHTLSPPYLNQIRCERFSPNLTNAKSLNQLKTRKSPNTRLRDENTSAVPPTLMPYYLKRTSSLISGNELIRELLTLVMRCTSWFLGRFAPHTDSLLPSTKSLLNHTIRNMYISFFMLL